MLKTGQYNDMVVDTKVEFGLYLTSGEDRILLPLKYVPEGTRIGDTLTVFVYTDSEDRPIATTLTPKGIVGDFAFLEAKDITPFGTFMDWGLEKDLLVPKSEQQDTMVTGKSYLIKICFDDSIGRVYGTARISANCDKDTTGLKEGQKVDLLIHSRTNIGIMAVINNRYYGMLYINEIYQDLEVGDTCTGYIMRLREDKKIDLTLKQPGFSSVKDSEDTIVNVLKEAGGFVACHDKSTPEDIKKHFSMSKKEFKRAVGGLFKKGLLELKEDGIQLKEWKWGK
ncbi:MAG: hypothetical protein KJ760_00530 [Proteobacteria bacterium]|nr:hypothetical protein [Pseudomonadota bacterium]